jgi:hypothetical protein
MKIRIILAALGLMGLSTASYSQDAEKGAIVFKKCMVCHTVEEEATKKLGPSLKGIVGRKAGMSRVFTEDGKSVPVTLIEATPNRITQIKTAESDRYAAVQLAFGWRVQAERRDALRPLENPVGAERFTVPYTCWS